jgi:hypothetical protein
LRHERFVSFQASLGILAAAATTPRPKSVATFRSISASAGGLFCFGLFDFRRRSSLF